MLLRQGTPKQAKGGRQMLNKERVQGKSATGDSSQRLSKSPVECKPKCDEELPR
jgi:hypothetical protein